MSFSIRFSEFEICQCDSFVIGIVGWFVRRWYGILYRHTQGSAAGQMGQRSGTLEEGLDDVDTLATEYEKFIFCMQVDFAKSI